MGHVLFLLMITQVLQGKMLTTFKEELKGNFHTVTRSIFVSFLAYAVLATLSPILLSVLGLMPDATNTALSGPANSGRRRSQLLEDFRQMPKIFGGVHLELVRLKWLLQKFAQWFLGHRRG